MALFMQVEDEKEVASQKPWEAVYSARWYVIWKRRMSSGYGGPRAAMLQAAAGAEIEGAPINFTETFAKIDKDWASLRYLAHHPDLCGARHTWLFPERQWTCS